jgi:phosphoglycolate phosphatase-like HAD superfamily hydrolase
VTADTDRVHEVPGIQLLKKLDIVGAGDTVTSALALCLGAGVAPAEASEFANFAAAVTVQKLFQTGTASSAEIIEIGTDPDYIYQPELASDIRSARYHEGTEIELCCESPPLGRIRHAVFDHDGTISTLRQGWEQIMAPVMIKAILGDEYETADETVYHKARNRVLDYINKSTGVQTIVQMEALVEMVREFAVVPADKIRDKFGYKQVYNDALMELVDMRIGKFKRGELDINDYTIKGALEFLMALKQRGIRLYLASGTDRQDVVAESEALGYAELFDGGTYGSVGDVARYSKKMVIARIMSENNLQGPELAVFGDGPVEIRECRKRDGISVGIASDEIRRHGLDAEKRSRLIKAGAHVLIPDFSAGKSLLKLLLGE